MADLFKQLAQGVSTALEAIAVVVIVLAGIKSFLRALQLHLGRPLAHDTTESVRIALGRWLALGLEFLIAADVLRTAVAPTWNEIGQLAAIILLRTLLNFFLERDIAAAERTDRSADRR